MRKPFLPIITGATATGKSACAVELCRLIDGEVVSADSMQIYKNMDILTAAVTENEMRGIKHHLIRVVEPTENFSVSKYRERAVQAIYDIIQRGKQPVICGGTGLYIDSIIKPMRFASDTDQKLRDELNRITEDESGRDRLHAYLEEIDPETAKRLHKNDIRRVIRAIEVYKTTGITLSESNRKDSAAESEFDYMIFALEIDRDELYARINRRVDGMVKNGLIDEVKRLKEQSGSHPMAFQAIGYKEISLAVDGIITYTEAIERVKQATRNYAKRQITYIKRDKNVIWIDALRRDSSDLAKDIYNTIKEKL